MRRFILILPLLLFVNCFSARKGSDELNLIINSKDNKPFKISITKDGANLKFEISKYDEFTKRKINFYLNINKGEYSRDKLITTDTNQKAEFTISIKEICDNDLSLSNFYINNSRDTYVYINGQDTFETVKKENEIIKTPDFNNIKDELYTDEQISDKKIESAKSNIAQSLDEDVMNSTNVNLENKQIQTDNIKTNQLNKDNNSAQNTNKGENSTMDNNDNNQGQTGETKTNQTENGNEVAQNLNNEGQNTTSDNQDIKQNQDDEILADQSTIGTKVTQSSTTEGEGSSKDNEENNQVQPEDTKTNQTENGNEIAQNLNNEGQNSTSDNQDIKQNQDDETLADQSTIDTKVTQSSTKEGESSTKNNEENNQVQPEDTKTNQTENGNEIAQNLNNEGQNSTSDNQDIKQNQDDEAKANQSTIDSKVTQSSTKEGESSTKNNEENNQVQPEDTKTNQKGNGNEIAQNLNNEGQNSTSDIEDIKQNQDDETKTDRSAIGDKVTESSTKEGERSINEDKENKQVQSDNTKNNKSNSDKNVGQNNNKDVNSTGDNQDKNNAQPDNAKSDQMLALILKQQSEIAKQIKDLKNPNYSLNIDAKTLAEKLAPKINYLNMDTYVGGGFFSWGIGDRIIDAINTDIQLFNLFFSTRMDIQEDLLLEKKPFKIYNYQPYLEGALQTISGRGAMLNLGYGIRLLNTSWLNVVSINGFLEGGYVNTETWTYDTISKDKVKFFYEGDAGLKFGFHRYCPNSKIQFGIMAGISWSLNPLKRTYNTVADGDVSNIKDYYSRDYETYSIEAYISHGLIKLNCGYKKYDIKFDEIFKVNGYEDLWQIQLSLRLNKN